MNNYGNVIDLMVWKFLNTIKNQQELYSILYSESIYLFMSHQKTKRIESPLKGMAHSMLIQNHQPSIFNSRITLKRKPIFYDTVRRSSPSRSNSMRKKIFSNTEKSIQKDSTMRFSKLFQAQQLLKREGEDINDKEIEQPLSNDSVQSSSIQQDSGLGEIKRQLFPQTPIKKNVREKKDLQEGRQWLTNSNKSCNKKLFQHSQSPPKSNLSASTNNIDRTTLKFSYITPQKKKQLPVQEKSYQKTQVNSENRPFIRNLNTQLSAKHNFAQKEPEKDIAKQIRDLHSKMMQKTKVCSNVDDQNRNLKEENQRLREQNKILKSQQLRLSIRPQESVKAQPPRQNQELIRIANQSIFVKVKVEKAKNMLKNLLQISQTEQLPKNSIISLERTLKQVLKQLQF